MRRLQEANADAIKQVKEEMIRSRNREIEAIIEKLGDETHDTQK